MHTLLLARYAQLRLLGALSPHTGRALVATPPSQPVSVATQKNKVATQNQPSCPRALSRHQNSCCNMGQANSIAIGNSLSRPRCPCPSPNPVATQHSLSRQGANMSLSRLWVLCHNPTLPACLGTLSRHGIPYRDTAAPLAKDPCHNIIDHVATRNPTTPIATEKKKLNRDRALLSQAQN